MIYLDFTKTKLRTWYGLNTDLIRPYTFFYLYFPPVLRPVLALFRQDNAGFFALFSTLFQSFFTHFPACFRVRFASVLFHVKPVKLSLFLPNCLLFFCRFRRNFVTQNYQTMQVNNIEPHDVEVLVTLLNEATEGIHFLGNLKFNNTDVFGEAELNILARCYVVLCSKYFKYRQ